MAWITVECRQINSNRYLMFPILMRLIRYHGTSDLQAARLNVYFNEVRENAGPRHKTHLVSEPSQH